MGNCKCSTSTTCSPCEKCGRYQVSWNDVRFKPNWVNSDNVPQTIKVSVSSVEILALNATPKDLLTSNGNGNVIDIVSVKIRHNAGTTPYTSANGFQVRYVGAANPILECDQSFVESSSDGEMVQMGSGTLTLTDNVASDAGIEVFIPNANPTLGDGTFDFYITYRTVTL